MRTPFPPAVWSLLCLAVLIVACGGGADAYPAVEPDFVAGEVGVIPRPAEVWVDAAMLTIIAHDRHGVLARVAAIFHRRRVAIRCLTLGPGSEPERTHLVVHADAPPAQLARPQAAIANLVDVVSVELA